MQDYQEAALFDPGEAIPLVPRRGWLLWVDEQPHDAPKFVVKPDTAYQNRKLLWEETFAGDRLAAEWTPALSKVANTRVEVRDRAFRIHAQGHVCAYAERALPAGVTLAQCEVDPGDDAGMTWGVGLELLWPGERLARVNVRAVEGRFGTDDGKEQGLHPSFVAPNLAVWLRLRVEAEQVVAEVSADGAWWEVLKTWPRASYAGDPVAIRVGKMAPAGNQDAGQAEREGNCLVSEVRVYGSK
ncbi:MAG: hypothetical protein HYU66_21060 [Armatimonadetes bacterium]|nr:hypothetical protein [Armatimonadota bacterium]